MLHLRLRIVAGALLGACFAPSCAPPGTLTRVADGTYRVECKQALATCLVRVHEVCSSHGYDVLTATERRETSGAAPVDAEYVKSSATVRCRVAVPVFGRDPNLPPPPIAASASAPVPSVPTVTPPAAGASSVPAPSTAPVPASPPAATPSPSASSGPPPVLPNPSPLPERPY